MRYDTLVKSVFSGLPFRRKWNLLPQVQFKFVLFAGIVGGLTLLPGIALAAQFLKSLPLLYPYLTPEGQAHFTRLLSEFKSSFLKTYVVTLVWLVLLSTIGGMYLSRVMVGPIVKLVQFLERITHGQLLTEFKLRADDEFKDLLEPAVNSALSKLQYSQTQKYPIDSSN